MTQVKTGKGWRETIRESPELVKDTKITLRDLEVKLKEVFDELMNRDNHNHLPFGFYQGGFYHLGKGIWGGEGAFEQINKMIKEEASAFITNDKDFLNEKQNQ